MTGSIDPVEVITSCGDGGAGRRKRRRASSRRPRPLNVGVAGGRKHGVAANLAAALRRGCAVGDRSWRGGGACLRISALPQIRRLQLLLGKKTSKPNPARRGAPGAAKKGCCNHPRRHGTTPVKTIADTLRPIQSGGATKMRAQPEAARASPTARGGACR